MTPTTSQLRNFGFVVGGVFALLFGTLIPLLRSSTLSLWGWAVGAPLLILATIAPNLLIFPFRLWMLIGEVLGWINSRIILGFVFFLLVTPVGLFRRLQLKKRVSQHNKSSYRVVVHERAPQTLERPF